MSVARAGVGRCGNGVLDRLPAADRAAVLARAQRVALARGERLFGDQQPIPAVYFPTGGLVALLVPIEDRPAFAVAMIGREGLVGAIYARGGGAGVLAAVVQGDGLAWRVPAADFAPGLVRRPGVHRAVEHAIDDVVAQIACTAACMPFHDIEQRLAGWLSLAAARLPDGVVHLTHQQLADLLGVQRSAVTLAAGSLQRRRLVHCTRGAIAVVEPVALEAASCGCARGASMRPPVAH